MTSRLAVFMEGLSLNSTDDIDAVMAGLDVAEEDKDDESLTFDEQCLTFEE